MSTGAATKYSVQTDCDSKWLPLTVQSIQFRRRSVQARFAVHRATTGCIFKGTACVSQQLRPTVLTSLSQIGLAFDTHTYIHTYIQQPNCFKRRRFWFLFCRCPVRTSTAVRTITTSFPFFTSVLPNKYRGSTSNPFSSYFLIFIYFLFHEL